MRDYLVTIYNQDHADRRIQLEIDMSKYCQGNKSIQEYHSGFVNLWAEYTELVYHNMKEAEILTLQKYHMETRRDQFLMKLRKEFESTRSSLMS